MHVIDFYDDPQGEVLKTKLAHAQLPDFIKTAHYITEEERDTLPDDVYALVMVDRHSKLRKYACVDKGNVALSVIYFLENRDRLPEEAQKTAAANLITACGWYDMKPPPQLMKLALSKGLLGRALSKARGEMWDIGEGLIPSTLSPEKQNMLTGRWASVGARKLQKLRQRQVSAFSKAYKAKTAEDIHIDLSELKKQIGKGKTVHVKLPHPEREKEADLVGSEVMPKTASLNPYVDVEGKTAPVQVTPPPRYEDEFYCLVKEGEAHFPIKAWDEVVQAREFFEANGFELHPEDRREYCVKLAARADALGIPVSEGIRKYAGKGYAPDGEIKIAVHTRLQYFTEDGPERDLLKGLLEKQASVPPEIFAEALRLFDETTGLDQHWDDAVYDPYYSTYGFTKEATWSFVVGNDRMTEDQLKELVKADHKLLKCKFGEELAEELAKKPREIFSSLPLDSKRIIMRMANEVGRTKAL